jgi:hypothetical protein
MVSSYCPSPLSSPHRGEEWVRGCFELSTLSLKLLNIYHSTVFLIVINLERRSNMKLYTNKELLILAKKGGYAVGAFNINNLEILKAIPRKILGPGREAIKQTVQSKMKLFGSSGKALQ